MYQNTAIAALTLLASSTLLLGATTTTTLDDCQSSCNSTLQSLVHAQPISNGDIVETAINAGSFETLVAAIKAADLVDALQDEGPFTVFAPTDDAFAALPDHTVETLLKPENKHLLQSILKYHVVPGKVTADQVINLSNSTTLNGNRIDITAKDGKVMIDNATVIKANIECDNGIIHVIDSVIAPSQNDIIDTAVSAGSFTTLAAALEATELIEALKGDGPFTVFAPTDDAFAALPDGTVDTLLKPENKDKLASILKLHVVSGAVYADQAIAAQTAATLQGKNLRFYFDKGQLMVNGAKIISTDVETANGIIHVIDQVILPE